MAEFWNEYGGLILEGLRDTTIMVAASTIFAYIIGLPLGVLLIVTRPGGIWERPWLQPHCGLDRQHRPVDSLYHPDDFAAGLSRNFLWAR